MITLIGKNLAEKGLKFVHYGPSAECEKCRFKNTCIVPLEEGRMYIITDVKDSEHPCPIHEEGKVKVVDVERAEIEALVDSKKTFEGSMVHYKPPQCEKDCTMYDLCFPEGLFDGDKCQIIKTLGKSPNKCIIGLNLKLVLLK